MRSCVRGVRKAFGPHVVLDDFSLDVHAHQVVCLIGASGSGKSTLMRCIDLLDDVDDGVVELDGREITDPRLDANAIRARLLELHERLKVEFELELFNSGSGPARAVLAEATLFNAGPAQDQQIGGFFSNPVGEGERIVMIPPLKRVALRTQVVAARDRMQAYELGGRQVFVPIIAFNALYGWTGGEGQTSASYLVGKDAKGEKLAPFRLEFNATPIKPDRIVRALAGA